MRLSLVAFALLGTGHFCGRLLVGEQHAPPAEAAEILSVSWYTRTLPTTDATVLAAEPPPQISQSALSDLTGDEQAAISRARRNGSMLQGLVWYHSPTAFAAAYMDPSSGAVSEHWAGLPEMGLPRFPLGSATCGRMEDFAWDSESGNLQVHRNLKQLPPALAWRLRQIEFLIAVDLSPHDAFTAYVEQSSIDGAIERTEQESGMELVWRSADESISIVFRLSHHESRHAEAHQYSWTMIANDSTRRLGTITVANIQRPAAVAPALPADPSGVADVYQGMVRMSVSAGLSTETWGSREPALTFVRRALGVGVFVAALCLLLHRKGQS